MTGLDAIRAAHKGCAPDECIVPDCDTARVFAALEAAMDESECASLRDERDAADEDAARLAEAGSHKSDCHRWPSEGVPCDCGWSEALRLHDERVAK